MILHRIPRLNWEEVANLFQRAGEFTGPVDPSTFVLVRDQNDRKFAALSAAAKSPLITNDNYLLRDLSIIGIDALTPRAFLTPSWGGYLNQTRISKPTARSRTRSISKHETHAPHQQTV